MLQYKDENLGTIYNIQRYSLHDGPGIRTIIFLKGCPLSCMWCSNPESQDINPQLMGDKVVGELISVNRVCERAIRDELFFKSSGGGVTLSGGEPLMQPEFAKAIVNKLRDMGINTAIETTGFQLWNKLWEVVRDIDVILYDLKAFDNELHERLTGVPNKIILDNLKRLSVLKDNITIRIPVIPSYNDGMDNLDAICEFVQNIGIKDVELLGYHRLGISKYKTLNREYKLVDVGQMTKNELDNIASKLRSKFELNIIIDN